VRLFDLKTEQWISRPPEELFPFFADAGNLQVLTPPWLHFRILRAPESMGPGACIDYKLRVHGIPLTWQSVITVWEPPVRFIDVQARGPYRAWIHQHTFEPRDGGTLMRDHVQYAVAGGVLVRNLLVAPDLKTIFDFRRLRLEAIFGSAR
jgi:ligand-binding SRPBCC domain-containing protein